VTTLGSHSGPPLTHSAINPTSQAPVISVFHSSPIFSNGKTLGTDCVDNIVAPINTAAISWARDDRRTNQHVQGYAKTPIQAEVPDSEQSQVISKRQRFFPDFFATAIAGNHHYLVDRSLCRSNRLRSSLREQHLGSFEDPQFHGSIAPYLDRKYYCCEHHSIELCTEHLEPYRNQSRNLTVPPRGIDDWVNDIHTLCKRLRRNTI